MADKTALFSLILLVKTAIVAAAGITITYLFERPAELAGAPAAASRKKAEVLGYESEKIRNLDKKLGLLREKYDHLQQESQYFVESEYKNEKITRLERMIDELESRNRAIEANLLARLRRGAEPAAIPALPAVHATPAAKKRAARRLYKFYMRDGQVFVGTIARDYATKLEIYNPATLYKFEIKREAIAEVVPVDGYDPGSK